MNKKKKIIGITSLGIVFIILIITIFKNTYAINPNTITLDCDKDSINSGDEFSCKIVGHFSNNVSGFSTSVSVSDDIEIVNIVSEWDATIKSIESDNTIVLADDENTITGDVNIANINLKNKGNSKDDSTIKLQKVSIAYEEGGISKDMDISDVVKNIHIKSSNSYLSFLSISGASIDFKSNITEYSIDSLDQSVITISATSSIASSTITGDLGEQKLEYGKNIFKVTVTSEDGNSTTYTINIYRPSGNSSLDSLSVEGTNVEFNSEKLNYDLIINSDKTNITATASSSTSKVEGTGEKKLAYGKNEFKIIVTAENGSERTYILNITRYDTNNTLKSIKINGEEVKINDNKEITKYEEETFENLTGKKAFEKIVKFHFIDSCWCYAYKMSYYKKEKFAFKKGTVHEDFGLVPLIILKAKKVNSIKYIGYDYYRRSGSIMNNKNYDWTKRKVDDMYYHYNNLLEESKKIKGDLKIFKSYIANCMILKITELNNKDYRIYLKKLKNNKVFDNLLTDTLPRKVKRVLLKISPKIYYKLIKR